MSTITPHHVLSWDLAHACTQFPRVFCAIRTPQETTPVIFLKFPWCLGTDFHLASVRSSSAAVHCTDSSMAKLSCGELVRAAGIKLNVATPAQEYFVIVMTKPQAYRRPWR